MTKGGVGAYKGGVHIAVVIRGGKVTLSTNNMGGRQLDLSTRRGFSEQNSCHAECSVIGRLPARREGDKWNRKRGKCRIYSLAFRYCQETHSIRPSEAKPCQMCSTVLHGNGFREVWYSEKSGQMCHDYVSNLLTSAIRCFGERRLEWVRHTRELLLAKGRGDLIRLHLRDERTFALIESGSKQIEGRLWRGIIRRLQRGQLVLIQCGERELAVHVTFIRRYSSFSELLGAGGGTALSKTLPEVSTIEAGVKRYEALYTRRDRRRYDAVAIGIKPANVRLSVSTGPVVKKIGR